MGKSSGAMFGVAGRLAKKKRAQNKKNRGGGAAFGVAGELAKKRRVPGQNTRTGAPGIRSSYSEKLNGKQDPKKPAAKKKSPAEMSWGTWLNQYTGSKPSNPKEDAAKLKKFKEDQAKKAQKKTEKEAKATKDVKVTSPLMVSDSLLPDHLKPKAAPKFKGPVNDAYVKAKKNAVKKENRRRKEKVLELHRNPLEKSRVIKENVEYKAAKAEKDRIDKAKAKRDKRKKAHPERYDEKGLSMEERLKMQMGNRMSSKGARELYEEAGIAEDVAKIQEESFNKTPEMNAFMDNFSINTFKDNVEASTGHKIDTSKAENTRSYKVFDTLGNISSYLLPGGLARGSVTKAIKGAAKTVFRKGLKAEAKTIARKKATEAGIKNAGKGISEYTEKKIVDQIAKSGTSKAAEKLTAKEVVKSSAKKTFKEKAGDVAAGEVADAIISAPVNAIQTRKEVKKNGGSFGKEFAKNTAMDMLLGTALGGASSAVTKKLATKRLAKVMHKSRTGQELTPDEMKIFEKVDLPEEQTVKAASELENDVFKSADNTVHNQSVQNAGKNLTPKEIMKDATPGQRKVVAQAIVKGDPAAVNQAIERVAKQNEINKVLETPTSKKAPQTLDAKAPNSTPKNESTVLSNKLPDPQSKVKTTSLKAEDVTPEYKETYNKYVDDVDPGIVKFVNKVKSGKATAKEKYTFGGIRRKEADSINEITGKDVDGYTHVIGRNEVEHIERRHGIAGEHDQTMADVNDVGRIRHILENYDNITRTVDDNGKPVFTSGYLDKNGKPAPLITYSKRVDGHHVVVEAVTDSAKKEIRVISSYMKKANKKAPHTVDANAPTLTSKNAYTDTFNNSISKNSDNVNKTTKQADNSSDVARAESRSRIHNDMKASKTPVRELAKDASAWFNRKFVDSMDSVNRIAKATGNKQLIATVNMARSARKMAEHHLGVKQTDFFGKEVGDSLKDIFKPIEKKGKVYSKDFQEYMFNLHNIDRMKQGKPVLGEAVTAAESKKIVDRLLRERPEFEELGLGVRKYLDNLQKYRIDSGMLSKEAADLMDDMYKNYVPTYRQINNTSGLKTKDGQITINGIKKASGSDKDLIPLKQQLANMTVDTVQAANTNKLVNDLVKATDAQISKTGKITTDDLETLFESSSKKADGKYTMTGYKDGEKFDVEIDRGLFEGLDSLKSKPLTNSEFINKAYGGLTSANNAFKTLITSWNPFFVVKNMARDIQDTTIYSKSLSQFIRQSPRSVQEMATNGKYWQLYKSMGGVNASFFDMAKGIKKDSNFLKKNLLDRVEDLNMYTEQFPRFTEFMATLQKGGVDTIEDLTTKEGRELLERAILASADVTVNFGRSGTIGKVINQSLVPFFNPAIQGFDKLARTLKGTKGIKEWSKLAFKLTMFGVAPGALNEMLLGDDKQYQSITDREKDVNYIFKTGDNQFIKIPKGRVLSMFSGTTQRTMRGEGNWAEFIDTAVDQVAPINPAESNFFSPVINAARNKTWYGADIEGYEDEGKPKPERYDERTSKIGKKLGEVTGGSPKKIDHLLDSYAGIIGDVALPATAPATEEKSFGGAFKAAGKKAFTIDTVLQNKWGTEYFNRQQAVQEAAKSEKATLKDKALNNYYKQSGYEQSGVRAAMKKIQNDESMPPEKRKAKARELKAALNDLYRTGAEGEKVFTDFVEKNADKFHNKKALYDAAQRQVEKRKSSTKSLDVVKEVMGTKYVLKQESQYVDENGDVKKLADSKGNTTLDYAKKYVKAGGTWDGFYNGYKELRKINKATGTSLDSAYTTAVAVTVKGKKLNKKFLKAYGVSEDDQKAADRYYKKGGSLAEYRKASEYMTNACISGEKPNYWAPFKALGLAKAKMPDRVYEAVDSSSVGVNTKYKMNTGRGLNVHKIEPKRLAQLNDKCPKNEKGYNTKEGVEKVLNKTKYDREERALLWDALYGLSYKETNPYGEIKDYSLKSDVGLDDTSNWRNYGGRGYRRYGGYGRSGGRSGGRGGRSGGSGSAETTKDWGPYLNDLLGKQTKSTSSDVNYTVKKGNTNVGDAEQLKKFNKKANAQQKALLRLLIKNSKKSS